MAYYRKKPVIIEAFRFGFDDAPDWWLQARMTQAFRTGDDVYIVTLEGDMRVEVGDWVIKGVAGELYPCKNDIFLKTYDKAEQVGQTITGFKPQHEEVN